MPDGVRSRGQTDTDQQKLSLRFRDPNQCYISTLFVQTRDYCTAGTGTEHAQTGIVQSRDSANLFRRNLAVPIFNRAGILLENLK